MYEIRLARLTPNVVDERIAKVVAGLREREFLKGTVFEKRALEMAVDPYSLLLGILIGIAITMIIGFATMEIWLPKAISRITRKKIEETTKAIREILGG